MHKMHATVYGFVDDPPILKSMKEVMRILMRKKRRKRTVYDIEYIIKKMSLYRTKELKKVGLHKNEIRRDHKWKPGKAPYLPKHVEKEKSPEKTTIADAKNRHLIVPFPVSKISQDN